MRLYLNGGWCMDISAVVLSKGLVHADNAYAIPNLRFSGRVCRTNLQSFTAMRGLGGPQVTLSLPLHALHHRQCMADADHMTFCKRTLACLTSLSLLQHSCFVEVARYCKLALSWCKCGIMACAGHAGNGDGDGEGGHRDWQAAGGCALPQHVPARRHSSRGAASGSFKGAADPLVGLHLSLPFSMHIQVVYELICKCGIKTKEVRRTCSVKQYFRFACMQLNDQH